MGDTSDVYGGTTWATYLRAARRSHGLTQEELADAVGIARQTIIRHERGDPADSETVVAIARVLRLPVPEALAIASGSETGTPLPPPLPRELARLVDAYEQMGDADRKALLGHVELVAEWAEARLVAGSTTKRRPRRVG